MKIRNIQHPFEYLLKKYIKPLGITQVQLQQDLHIGIKTLSELYNYKRGISPVNALKFGKYFDIPPELLMRMQAEYELKKAYNDHQHELTAINRTANQPQRKEQEQHVSPTRLLLSAINNSLSDRATHYTEKELENMFSTTRLTKRKRYAITVLFREVPAQQILDFVRVNNIPITKLKHLYTIYLEKIHGTRNLYFEWLFQDVQRSN